MNIKAKTISLLGSGGVISKVLDGYEDRPEQIEMAAAVADAYMNAGKLMVEAGTGVGKSFAYLVPSILFSVESGEPIVVSTNTISLQEQLLGKDIPVLKSALPVDFTAVLLKGRSNYLCRRRLEMTASSQRGLFESREEVEEFDRVRKWSETTTDGSLADLIPNPPASVWQLVCSEGDNCLSTRCRHFRNCFYYLARDRAADANLIIVNHHLLFSDYVLKVNGVNTVIPPYEHLVMDEGHNIEQVATDHIGREISNWRVKRLLDGLYRPTAREATGILARLGAAEYFGEVENARKAASDFFDLLSRWIGDRTTRRIDKPNFIPNLLEEPLIEIGESLKELRKKVSDENEEMEVAAYQRRCRELRTDLDSLLSISESGEMYWAEKSNRRFSKITLNASPLNVSKQLDSNLFSQLQTVVVTSATLAVRGSFSFIKSRIGLSDAEEKLIGSPFDYRRQVTLYLHKSMPDPRSKEFVSSASKIIEKYIRKTQGKAFVLFTSYRMLDQVFENLVDVLESSGISVLKQGGELPRTEMLRLFREDIDSVIFGTSSFWEGVDVQGKALSNVIIVKLPFSVPDHPIIQARLEEIEKKGGNPFYEYSLPEAVLRLKQGFGRLIRTKSDQGMVVILDPRIITKSYGDVFLQSLPECETVII